MLKYLLNNPKLTKFVRKNLHEPNFQGLGQVIHVYVPTEENKLMMHTACYQKLAIHSIPSHLQVIICALISLHFYPIFAFFDY